MNKKDLTTQLIKAANAGSLEDVKNFIAAGADITATTVIRTLRSIKPPKITKIRRRFLFSLNWVPTLKPEISMAKHLGIISKRMKP